MCDGLDAHSVNCWPSVEVDLGALNDSLSRLFPAGFYYKTFMSRPWDFYSGFIRRMAGLGRVPIQFDATRYERRHHHCDVLVVGAGPAGLAAAASAGASGARVMLVDDQTQPGGSLLNEPGASGPTPVMEWVASTAEDLDRMPHVLRLSDTTAAGYYDHNLLTVVERIAGGTALSERLWHVRANQVVIAAGAVERPLVFPNNDRPGVMLASAARTFVNRYAVKPGGAALVFTNNSSAYAPAFDLAAAGIAVKAIVDSRDQVEEANMTAAREREIPVYPGHVVTGVAGGKRVTSAAYAPRSGAGRGGVVDCDLVCMSGGWNPLVHLHSQSGGRPQYDVATASFVPGVSVQAERCAGAAAGLHRVGDCLDDGVRAGREAAKSAGFEPVGVALPAADPGRPYHIEPLWEVDSDVPGSVRGLSE